MLLNEDKNAMLRRELTEGTIETVAALGLENTTTNAICKTCGVNVAYIYRFFSDKEDLIAKSFADADRRFLEVILDNYTVLNYESIDYESRCHYLCLLPFVNEKNVSGIYRVFFHKPRHTKEKESGILRVLVLSFIGMGICAVSLCGATWAWFTATTSAGTAVIQAASYTVTVTAKSDEENLNIAVKDGVSTAVLEAEKKYTVTLTPGGTATAGYCKITLGGKDYYTGQLTADTLTFKVSAAKKQDLTVTPQWGSYSGEATVKKNSILTSE